MLLIFYIYKKKVHLFFQNILFLSLYKNDENLTVEIIAANTHKILPEFFHVFIFDFFFLF